MKPFFPNKHFIQLKAHNVIYTGFYVILNYVIVDKLTQKETGFEDNGQAEPAP